MKEQPGRMQTELVPVGAATLWTQTSGQGRPLVICHGGPGMSDNLEPLAQMVEDLATVHRFDQRACGRSTGVGEGQTVAGAVADLEALRAHWGHRRWLVGGHSWGATLALCYTLAHFDRVTGLLYLSGPGLDATATTRDRVRASRLARLTEAERTRLVAAEHRLSGDSDDEDAAAAIARLLWLTDFADRSSVPDFTTQPLFAYPRNPEAAAALSQDRIRWLADPTLRRRLRKLAVPTLVLHGERDPLPADGAAELARLLPSARLEILPGAGHTPWLEGAAAVRQAMRRFVNAIPMADGPTK
jgi:proline iminopeptidase